VEVKRQADAAQSQVEIMKEQFQLDQRPYLTVTITLSSDIVTRKPSQPTKGNPLVVNLVIKNIGKSMALSCVTHRHLVFGEANLRKITPEPIGGVQSFESIAPGEPIVTSVISLRYHPHCVRNIELEETIPRFSNIF
jgi:hypothetical protein